MSVYPTKNLTPITIIKLLLLGQSNVGKTSLATRYAEDRFNAQNNLLTVGIDIRKIDKQIKGKNVRLEIWDTAGQEKYKTIPSQYFKGVQGIILVYDITDNESFNKIQDWIEKIQQNRGYDQLVMMLVGNKIDRNNQREVKQQQANNFAVEKGMGFNQTSAKESLNVDQMIDQVIGKIFQKGIKCTVKNIKLDDNKMNKRQMQESGCCS